MKNIFIFSLLVLVIACSNKKKIFKVYEHREEVLSFLNQSIMSRSDKLLVLYSYNDKGKNIYTFEKVNSKYVLKEDSLTYNMDSTIKINTRDTNYKNDINKFINETVLKMDALYISDVSSEFKRLGIDLKIYLKNGAVMFYIQDTKQIKNPEWIKYYKSFTPIDSFWYYKLEEGGGR